jgi:hypothetical protein
MTLQRNDDCIAIVCMYAYNSSLPCSKNTQQFVEEGQSYCKKRKNRNYRFHDFCCACQWKRAEKDAGSRARKGLRCSWFDTVDVFTLLLCMQQGAGGASVTAHTCRRRREGMFDLYLHCFILFVSLEEAAASLITHTHTHTHHTLVQSSEQFSTRNVGPFSTTILAMLVQHSFPPSIHLFFFFKKK